MLAKREAQSPVVMFFWLVREDTLQGARAQRDNQRIKSLPRL
jgi:hypothetical protein